MHRTCSKKFDWWPTVTHKQNSKTGYSAIKSLILPFKQASQIVAMCDTRARLIDIQQTDLPQPEKADEADRIPVVCILGHKDHGKTTLLDSLRNTHVASREEFGITQEMYSFVVTIKDQPITFLDTPGHHNFFDMRETAAYFADACLIVVAADEGLLEQTKESIAIAKQYNCPIIVVINKIDALDAKVVEVRSELVKQGIRLLSPHESVMNIQNRKKNEAIAVEISAKYKTNLSHLTSSLQSLLDTVDLTTRLNAPPIGAVIESLREDRGRGNVIRCILRHGVLKVGDWFASGLFWGKVRAMRVQGGITVKEIGPGIPVEIMGSNGLPNCGSDFIVCSQERAEEISDFRRLEFEYLDNAQQQQEEQDHIEQILQKQTDKLTEQFQREEDDIKERTKHQLERGRRAEVDDNENDEDYDEEYDDDEEYDEEYDDEEVNTANQPLSLSEAASIDPSAPSIPSDVMSAITSSTEVPHTTTVRASERLPRRRVLPGSQDKDSRRDRMNQLSMSHARMVEQKRNAKFVEVRDSAQRAEQELIDEGEERPFPVILKTVNVGALTMLSDSVDRINEGHGRKVVDLFQMNSGGVTKTDISHASAAKCGIYMFRSELPGPFEKQFAKKMNVPLKHFRNFEELLDQLQIDAGVTPIPAKKTTKILDQPTARRKQTTLMSKL